MALYLGSTAVKLGSATKPESGGTETEVVLQSKIVSPSTSLQTVLPDDGYNGLSQVTINAIKIQSKTVSPSTTSQVITPDSNFDGLSQVTVDAITTQSKTVTPSVTAQSITPDNGYSGLSRVTVNAMPTGALSSPTISVSSSGVITAISGVTTAGYLSTNESESNTKNLTTQAAKKITPSTSSQTAVASGVYTTGAVTVDPIPSSYVKPTYTQASKEWIPSKTVQTISAGTYLTGAQTIRGDVNLDTSNIKNGVSIFGVTGTLKSGFFAEVSPTSANSFRYNSSEFTSLPSTMSLVLIGEWSRSDELLSAFFRYDNSNGYNIYAIAENGYDIYWTNEINISYDAGYGINILLPFTDKYFKGGTYAFTCTW